MTFFGRRKFKILDQNWRNYHQIMCFFFFIIYLCNILQLITPLDRTFFGPKLLYNRKSRDFLTSYLLTTVCQPALEVQSCGLLTERNDEPCLIWLLCVYTLACVWRMSVYFFNSQIKMILLESFCDCEDARVVLGL